MVTCGYELPVSTDLASTECTRMKSTKRPQQNENKSEFCLQLMDLYTKLDIFQLVEDFPSNRLRGMHRFHDRLSLRLPSVAYPRKPTWSCIRLHHLTSALILLLINRATSINVRESMGYSGWIRRNSCSMALTVLIVFTYSEPPLLSLSIPLMNVMQQEN